MHHHDRLVERLFRREVAIERPGPDTGSLGDDVDRHVDPVDGEHLLRGREQSLAVLDGVGPHGPR